MQLVVATHTLKDMDLIYKDSLEILRGEDNGLVRGTEKTGNQSTCGYVVVTLLEAKKFNDPT